MSTRVLFLIVAYNNHAEVDEFIKMARRLPNSQWLAFSICDNSTKSCVSLDSDDVTLTLRPDNPGYLEGALVALETFVREEGAMPDWIFLTNTDLTFESVEFWDALNGHSASEAVMLAPRITETERRLEKNPHLQEARGSRRLAINALLTSTTSLAYGYMVLSVMRDRLGARAPKRPVLSRRPGESSTMYAPYGAIVGFSRTCLEAHALPRDVPLFAEEFVIAEVARRSHVPVVYEPRIYVHHHAHAATGLLASRQRAAMLRVAFKYIWRYHRDPFPSI